MFFILSKLLDVFLSPYTWGLLLLTAAVPWTRRALRSTERSFLRRRVAAAAGLALLLLASTESVSNRLVYSLEHATAPTYQADVVYDYVVLLGGITDERVVAETGQPSYNENVERLVATHRLLRDGKARTVIVSGAAMDPSLAPYGEARVLGRQLEDWGIAPARILLEERARNTRENAVYSKEMIDARGGANRVLIVTSAFHMRRALECFNAAGLPVDTLLVDYRAFDPAGGASTWLPRANFLSVSTAAVREIFGWLVYRAQGYAKPALISSRS